VRHAIAARAARRSVADVFVSESRIVLLLQDHLTSDAALPLLDPTRAYGFSIGAPSFD
jgi:hypothetical protein